MGKGGEGVSRIVAIVQARLASQRLPRKVLADICGRPMLQHVVERAQAIPGIDLVCLAVPEGEYADFFPVAVRCDVEIYEGPGRDVLARYAKVANATAADLVMRLTADCPLLAPEVCGDALQMVAEGPFDYATNDTTVSGWPDGLDVQVFTKDLLHRAHLEATDPYDREHVCPWIERNADTVAVLRRDTLPWAGPKLSVDTPEDLDRVRTVMARTHDCSWLSTAGAIRSLLTP